MIISRVMVTVFEYKSDQHKKRYNGIKKVAMAEKAHSPDMGCGLHYTRKILLVGERAVKISD